jgi:cytochrome c
MNRFVAIAIASLVAAPAFAEGDAAKGEKTFNKCKACHMIADDAGTVIFKGGKTGPNLYGIAGRTAGSADFRYGNDLVAAGEKGLVWDLDNFTAFVADSRGFLSDYLGSSAKSKMSFRLKSADDAADIWAYIESVSN